MPDRSQAILIIGGGGHALVVADAATQSAKAIIGFLDDNPDARLTRRQDRLGGLSMLDKLDLIHRHPVILALGDLTLRRRLIPRLPQRDATVIHPSAIVSPTATIGAGVYIGPGAIVHTDAVIGDHVILNTASVVEHDCVVGVNTHLAPNSTLGGDVVVGDDTLIGLGASVLPGVRIGDHCTVGAGSAVIQDLPTNATAVGVPARTI